MVVDVEKTFKSPRPLVGLWHMPSPFIWVGASLSRKSWIAKCGMAAIVLYLTTISYGHDLYTIIQSSRFNAMDNGNRSRN